MTSDHTLNCLARAPHLLCQDSVSMPCRVVVQHHARYMPAYIPADASRVFPVRTMRDAGHARNDGHTSALWASSKIYYYSAASPHALPFARHHPFLPFFSFHIVARRPPIDPCPRRHFLVIPSLTTSPANSTIATISGLDPHQPRPRRQHTGL